MGEELRSRNWVMVAFFTDSYAGEIAKLKESAEGKGIDLIIEKIEFRGSWQRTVRYKAELILKWLTTQKRNVVHVDADATIERDPILFDVLECDLAYHRLKRPGQGTELLGGTLYFKNNEKMIRFCEKWVEECKSDFEQLTQVKLEKTLKKCGDDIDQFILPVEYCGIFDHPSAQGKELVIKHWQASRRLRKD